MNNFKFASIFIIAFLSHTMLLGIIYTSTNRPVVVFPLLCLVQFPQFGLVGFLDFVRWSFIDRKVISDKHKKKEIFSLLKVLF